MARRYLIGQEEMYALSVGQLRALLAPLDDNIPVVTYRMTDAQVIAPLKAGGTADLFFSGPGVLADVTANNHPAEGEPIQEALIIWIGSPQYNAPDTQTYNAITG